MMHGQKNIKLKWDDAQEMYTAVGKEKIWYNVDENNSRFWQK